MKKLTLTLSAAALVFGSMILSASAQTQGAGAASVHALKNATPIVTQAACRGVRPALWARLCLDLWPLWQVLVPPLLLS